MTFVHGAFLFYNFVIKPGRPDYNSLVIYRRIGRFLTIEVNNLSTFLVIYATTVDVTTD